MENKMPGFQFESVFAKQTGTNYSAGSDRDETEIQYDRLKLGLCVPNKLA